MRKIFTTALCALALGGFSAAAATTTIVPTADPAAGTLGVGEWWPGQIILTWEDQSIAINTNDANYDGDGYIINIPMTVNGQSVADEWQPGVNVTLNASAVYYYDAGGYGWWEMADENNPGTALAIGGFPFFESAPNEGEYLEFTLPAGCVIIGGSDTNAVYNYKLTVGEVEYDDTNVKTFGSSVYFDNAGSCQFITRLSDVAPMAIVSDSDINLAEFISLVYKVDPNDPTYDKTYSFDVVKMADGKYAYNFKQVTDSEMTFTYTGTTPVTFTFQAELADGEQESGLKNMGEFTFGVPFTMEKNQTYTYTFTEPFSGDVYVKINTSTNVMNNGTLVITNAGDMVLTEGWKTGTGTSKNYQLIAATDGSYGYTGSLNISYPQTIYVSYTGSATITVTMGEGEFTENGVADYMQPATQNTDEVSVNDKTASIELSWGEKVTMVHADYTLSYTFNGEPTSSAVEIKDWMQFLSTESGEPSTGIAPLSVANDESGDVLLLLFGGAVGNDPQIGVYEFTIPAGIVKNAKGNLNPKQIVKITVVGATEGVVSPVEDYEFENGEDVVFTVEFEETPVINTEVEEPLFVTAYNETFEDLRFDWAEGVLYIDGNSVVMNLGNDFKAGTYYFSLAEGAVTINGGASEGIYDYRFIVKPAADEPTISYLEEAPIVSPDPKEDALDPFTEVLLSWEGYTLKLVDPAPAAITFDGEEVVASINENGELSINVLATDNGTFSLVVPEGFLIATDADGNEYYNKALQFVFVVDADTNGVNAIAGANGEFNVVNLQGVKVLNSKDASSLKTLPKGIYIINGKKVAL